MLFKALNDYNIFVTHCQYHIGPPAQITVTEKVVLLRFCCSTVVISSHASGFYRYE